MEFSWIGSLDRRLPASVVDIIQTVRGDKGL